LPVLLWGIFLKLKLAIKHKKKKKKKKWVYQTAEIR
jgi:hypothetical protein